MKNTLFIFFSMGILGRATAQNTDPLVKFVGIKTCEIAKTPEKAEYTIVPNWLKIPLDNTPKVVSAVKVI